LEQRARFYPQKGDKMSTYPLEKLLSLWKSGSITVEQLAGYMLQHLLQIEKRQEAMEKATKYLKPPPPSSDEGVRH
jgi:hypothetical protein